MKNGVESNGILGRNWANGANRELVAPLMAGAGLLAGVGAGVGAALASYAFLREPFEVELERRTISLPRARGRLPRQGLRLLHISDLHFRGADRREQAKVQRVLDLVRDVEYDLIVHTGDFLHHDGGLANVLRLVRALPRPRLGSYAVLGNHDYATYDMSKALRYTWRNFIAQESRRKGVPPPALQPSRVERTRQYVRFGLHLLHNRVDGEPTGANDVPRLRYELEQRGVQVLHNRSVHLNSALGQEGLDLYLAGVDDLQEGHPDLAAAFREVPSDAPLVLLAHNPDILQAPAALRADLVLAGHTHGGQIVLPLIGPAHTQTELLSRRHASGYLRRGNTQIYINRGLGEGIPLRFGAPPQITLIT
ncbi:MAG: hypothetical protein D6790_11910, partial [Caldilineae bacterium]